MHQVALVLVGSLIFLVTKNPQGTFPEFDFALYRPVQVATLFVFHNKQVKNKTTVSS